METDSFGPSITALVQFNVAYALWAMTEKHYTHLYFWFHCLKRLDHRDAVGKSFTF